MTPDCTKTPDTPAVPRGDVPSLMLRELCRVLGPLGITTVTIAYDGYGDEGQIETIDLRDADNVEQPMPEGECASWSVPWKGDATAITGTIASAIEDFGYEMLALHHAGWENGEGAYGELVIDVPEKHAEMQHSTRFIETDCTIHELEG